MTCWARADTSSMVSPGVTPGCTPSTKTSHGCPISALICFVVTPS